MFGHELGSNRDLVQKNAFLRGMSWWTGTKSGRHLPRAALGRVKRRVQPEPCHINYQHVLKEQRVAAS